MPQSIPMDPKHSVIKGLICMFYFILQNLNR